MDWREARYRYMAGITLRGYEGYKDLHLSTPVLLSCTLHIDSLRVLRNGTFHYQRSIISRRNFSQARRKSRMGESLPAPSPVFSEYRSEFMVKSLFTKIVLV